MTDKGTIVLPKFHGTWGEADIGEFEWTSRMCSSCRSNVSSGQNCQLISCFQKTGSRTILWSCSAAGTFFMTNPSTAKQSVFNFWNGSFGNQCTEFHARYDKTKLKQACKVGSQAKIHVSIIDSFYADLSQPNNPLIKSSEDAVKLKIDGKEIWISKKQLSYHSHFFDVFFNGDFKEKAEDFYELKDVNIADFLVLLGIVHDLKMPIQKNSVEGLLKIGDFFQCKSVLERCEEFLKTTSAKCLSLLEKLELALRFKLNSTLTDVIATMTVEELNDVYTNYEFPAFARDLLLMKLCLNDA